MRNAVRYHCNYPMAYTPVDIKYNIWNRPNPQNKYDNCVMQLMIETAFAFSFTIQDMSKVARTYLAMTWRTPPIINSMEQMCYPHRGRCPAINNPQAGAAMYRGECIQGLKASVDPQCRHLSSVSSNAHQSGQNL